MGEIVEKFTTGGLIVTYSLQNNKYIIFLSKYPIITLVDYSDYMKVFAEFNRYQRYL